MHGTSSSNSFLACLQGGGFSEAPAAYAQPAPAANPMAQGANGSGMDGTFHVISCALSCKTYVAAPVPDVQSEVLVSVKIKRSMSSSAGI